MLLRAPTILLLATLTISTSHSQPATRVYAANYSDVSPFCFYSFGLDGSGRVEVALPMRPMCLAVDWKSAPQKIYIGLLPTSGVGKIIRCNVDGSDTQDVVTNTTGVSDIELDLDNRKVFWLQDTYNDDRIYYADMDGVDSHVTEIYHTTVPARDLWGLALDAAGQRLWITERGSTAYASSIRRMSCTGSGATTIVSPIDNPHDIEYFDNKLYWGDRGGLVKANTDGTGRDTLVANARIYGLAIDGTNRRIYYSDYNLDNIRRVDDNGANLMDFTGLYGSVTNLDVDYNPGAVEVEESRVAPIAWRLEQCFPNPFNPSTVIEYTVAADRGQGSGVSMVRLSVYDMLGREVAVLVNERQAPGRYEVRFDGANLASGVYLYRLRAGCFTQARRMVLVR